MALLRKLLLLKTSDLRCRKQKLRRHGTKLYDKNAMSV